MKNIKRLIQKKQGSLKTNIFIATTIIAIALVSIGGIDNSNYNSSTISPNKYVKVFGSAVKQPIVVYKNQYGIVTANGISIRTGAGIQYSWQGSFAIGTKLNILGTAGSFYKVSYSGKTGYVSNQFVKITAKPVVAVTPKTVYKTQYGLVTANGISIRTGAGAQYSWQGSFAIGTKLNILGTAGSFYKVSYSGKTGYVSNQFVKITVKTPPSSFKEAVNIILQEDGKYLKGFYKKQNLNPQLISITYIKDYIKYSDIPNEKVYFIEMGDMSDYFVGIQSGNVYAIPHQGAFRVYQMKDNKIYKYFRYKESDGTYDEDKYPNENYSLNWHSL